MSELKLNLGCGKEKLDGYLNIDKYEKDADLNLDLNKIPYPFKNNCVDEIILSHVLEHLNNPYEVVMECSRILKKGGKLKIILPTYCNIIQHRTYTHGVGFLNVLFKQPSKYNKHYDKQLDYRINHFELKKFNKILKQSATRRLLSRIRDFVYSFMYNEYEWVLEKK